MVSHLVEKFPVFARS